SRWHHQGVCRCRQKPPSNSARYSNRRRSGIARFPREFVDAGGLMSYGANNLERYRHVGIYTGRILKGEKPADMPVQQAVKVVFALTLKTANTLGLSIPLPLLGRADEVME